MTQRIVTAIRLVGHLGAAWAWSRASTWAASRLGLFKVRNPARPWRAWDAASARAAADAWRRGRGRFFFTGAERARRSGTLRSFDGSGVGPLAEAMGVRSGRFRYFSFHEKDLGVPPDWFLDPWTGERVSGGGHWSEVEDFGAGDIKVLWEPSRFAWVYGLVRSYWRDGDEGHAEVFWRWFESWRDVNPPATGPQWRCGQEASFRAMALCFGLWGFEDAVASTDERIAALLEVLEFTGCRIACHVGYALSQQNNHGVSEAAGLFTIGTLFPWMPLAGRWRVLGRGLLERLAREVIYDDGGFSQHSFNYHRVMLHDFAWVLRLATLAGDPFGRETCARVRTSARLLATWTADGDGTMPNHGGNDGALVLPLDNAGYGDFRGASQLASLAAGGPRLWGRGPWDESEVWLFGEDARGEVHEPVAAGAQAAPDAGYHGWTGRGVSVFLHVPRFKHRPAHADLLHCDVMLGGVRLSLDPGSYSYNMGARAGVGLASVHHHGTVSLDGREPMRRVSRFIWLPWPTCRVLGRGGSEDGSWSWVDAEHDGYGEGDRPALVRRRVALWGEHTVVVLDRVVGAHDHEARVHWLLPADAFRDEADSRWCRVRSGVGMLSVGTGTLSGGHVVSLVHGEEGGLRGWRSAYYLGLERAASLACVARGRGLAFWSVFTRLEDPRVWVDAGELVVGREGMWQKLAWPGA